MMKSLQGKEIFVNKFYYEHNSQRIGVIPTKWVVGVATDFMYNDIMLDDRFDDKQKQIILKKIVERFGLGEKK